MPDEPTNVTPFPLPPTSSNGTGEAPSPFPKRPKRPLTLETAKVAGAVIRRAEEIEDERDRGQWMEQRVQRYAKYRGWLETKDFPWRNSSNVHIPILQTAELRANAGLHNVVMTLRPLLRAKSPNTAGVDKEERVSRLVDYQLLAEPGPDLAERRLGDYISSFLQDGNAVAYTPWVRAEGEETLVTYRPGIPEGLAPADYIEELLLGRTESAPGGAQGRTGGFFPADALIELDKNPEVRHIFHVTYRERSREKDATVEIFSEDDGTLCLHITREVTRYDGPVMLPLAISDVLVPTRCANLQPPTAWNPDGAPDVFLRRRYRLDEIKRLKESGDFNYLDAGGLDAIIASAKTSGGLGNDPADALETQKDDLEGREHVAETSEFDEGIGHLEVDVLIDFGRWDIDGDGLDEDVYFVVARDARVLLEARRLTERWPADRPYRPLAEAVAIPVPGRFYGISLLELGEHLYDLMKATFDQSFDAWTIANIPSGFYAASSKINADIIQWTPGQFYPVPGSPRENIYIPQWPQQNQQTALGILNLAYGFLERQMAIGPLQAGQVPTGKASALRTFGTTSAILQQGDVRADQLLIRLFSGLAQVARNFHRMNRHLLPDGKEFRVLGWDGPAAEGYQRIESVAEIDAEIDFEFRPDFLLTNPAVLSQALQSLLGVIATPLAFQLGITDPTLFSRAVRDFVRSLRLDPKLYVKAPTAEGLPAILAGEAIAMVMDNHAVRAVPLEGAEPHLKELIEFMQSDHFAMLTEAQSGLLQAWAQEVSARLQQERVVQQAQAFQQQLQGGQPPGLGAVPSAIGQEPTPGTGDLAAPVGEATA